jgi:hypothetical protein
MAPQSCQLLPGINNLRESEISIFPEGYYLRNIMSGPNFAEMAHIKSGNFSCF